MKLVIIFFTFAVRKKTAKKNINNVRNRRNSRATIQD